MYFIPWDDRLFLVSESQMISFCNHVNEGAFRNGPRFSIFALREPGGRGPLSAKPVLPQAFRSRLLDHPIKGAVTRVFEATAAPNNFCSYPLLRRKVDMDIGAHSGVQVGMRVFNDNDVCYGTVASVQDDQCVVALDDTTLYLKTGLKLHVPALPAETKRPR
jgi:hypothetical protein